MKISTTRFGDLEIDRKDIITFNEGLLGFEQFKKFIIVDPGDQTLILWFQSIDDAATAFPIIEPKIFNPDYSIKLLPNELNSLDLETVNQACVYTILTIPKNITEMSANMKAPIVINNQTKKARQIVLQDNKLDVKAPMYKELKQHIVAYASDDTKRTQVESPSVTSPEAEENSIPLELEADTTSTSGKSDREVQA